MKRLSLIVFLVCLMSNSVFASWFWMQADESIPPWAATDNWTESNQWNIVQVAPAGPGPGPPPLNTILEIKMITEAWMAGTAHCTIDSNVGTYIGAVENSGRISINGTLTINGEANFGVIRIGRQNGLRVGSQTAGGITTTGTVNQSAGTVTVSNLYLGYGGTMTSGAAEGYYVISGGSFTVTDDPNSGGVYTGGLSVGSGVNINARGTVDPFPQTIGKFTVVGPNSTISATSLTVGSNITGWAGTTNSGTLEFKLGSGVSPINVSSRVFLDPNNVEATIAALVVTLTNESAPLPVIVLVKNSSGYAENDPDKNPVVGVFDSVSGDQNGGRAEELDTVVLTTPLGTHYYYRMSYRYNAEAGTFGNGNDIALVPEPATIALFGLGLLALVRRPRRK